MTKLQRSIPTSSSSASRKANTGLTNFTLFLRLPLELQNIIWSFSISFIPPRYVSLRPRRNGNIIPPLLHVSNACRSFAQKYYTRLTANSVRPEWSIWETQQLLPRLVGEQVSPKYAMFIDYLVDTLCLNHQDILIDLVKEGRRTFAFKAKMKRVQKKIRGIDPGLVKNIAIDVTEHESGATEQDERERLMKLLLEQLKTVFPNIERVTLLMRDRSTKNFDLRNLREIKIPGHRWVAEKLLEIINSMEGTQVNVKFCRFGFEGL